MNCTIVIVAGGKGNRMGAEIPKQFIELDGKPILIHTIEKFYNHNPNYKIRVVLPKQEIDNWNSLCKSFSFPIAHEIKEGGNTRFQSVKNGLEGLTPDGIIAIHDGVRPLVSKETINRCLQAVDEHEAVIPVIAPYESVREIIDNNSNPVDRTKYVLIQTPQVFKAEVLIKAYEQPESDEFTDDATVVEKLGHKIHLAEGNRENIKLTTPIDLILAEALLKK